MTKILVVEDESALQTLLKYNLEKQSYEVCSVMDGREALSTILTEKPDLILLDWMLPNISGIDICKDIRKNPDIRTIPIIMLTARGSEADKVKGLSFGADDYVTKPFSIPELIARIGALLRRIHPMTNLPEMQELGDLRIDYAKHIVMRGNEEIHLGPTEFRLLQCLMEKPGDVCSREKLLKTVWGGSVYVELRTVDVHIKRLRNALNIKGKEDIIRTIRSVGYAMVLPD